MAMSNEERLRRQRERDTARRERIKQEKLDAEAARLAALTPAAMRTEEKKTKQEVYLHHLERGLRRGAAARATNVDITTVREWRRHDPEFIESELRAEESAAETVEDALYQSAMNGNTQAQLYWLQNRAPARWRDKNRAVDVTVTHTGQIEAGERLSALGELLSRVEARALGAGPDPNVIDVEVVD